jgi:hypothetical protein
MVFHYFSQDLREVQEEVHLAPVERVNFVQFQEEGCSEIKVREEVLKEREYEVDYHRYVLQVVELVEYFQA